jgi:hypothetical protein
MLSLELLKKINKKDFYYDTADLKKGIFCAYLNLPSEIKKIYNTKAIMFVEYNAVKEEYTYLFLDKDKTSVVNNDFNCKYMNDLVIERFFDKFF